MYNIQSINKRITRRNILGGGEIHTKVWLVNLRGKLDVNGRLILKWNLNSV
jgi:hypothetical protein